MFEVHKMHMGRLIGVLALAVGPVLSGAAAPALGYGDYDGDGDVDLDDFAKFAGCMEGPGGGLGADCDIFDFNTDAAVDLFDFAGFQRVFGAPPFFPVVIDTVPVGNPGNANDPEGDGYGGVAYVYNIGKYEVTAGQYTEFLNAVADDDTYGLYNANMWSNRLGCKIERTGPSPNYEYSVAADWAARPVNWVSWGDAARFANWLHNGQPTGPQNLSTTENGSYFLDGAMSGAELLAIVRDPDATWVIPSEDEWYKAAYHKNDGVTGNYFNYPMSTDSVPRGELIDPDRGNSANFFDSGFTIGSPYYRSVVGDFENSESPYDTFDQGGNIWEWNEAILYGSYPGLRGGCFYFDEYYLRAAVRADFGYPTFEINFIGFRVAEVP